MVIGKKLLLAAGLGLFAISLFAIIIALVILIGANNVSPDHDQKIAADYFNGLSVDGYTFRVLKNISEIPYTEGDAKDPSKYWSVIPPFKDTWPLPVNNSGLESVKLYTWSEKDGLLIQWDLVISGDNVTMVNANLVDAGLGSYKDSNKGFFDVCKNIMVSGPTAKDVFDQYRRIYEDHNDMLINTAINYIDDRLELGGHILLVLNSSNDIPYKDGNLKKPGDYSAIIHSPAVSTWPFRQPNDTDYGKIDSVSLYTWSCHDGLLIKWDVRMAGDRVVQINANLVDLEVGDYRAYFKDRYIYGKGVNLSGTYIQDIYERHIQLYRDTTNMDFYPVQISFYPGPMPPKETRPLTIHFWKTYRSDFKAGEKCYIAGYITEKTSTGYDLDAANSRVDIVLKKGESIVSEGSDNVLASGFWFSYDIPDNERPTDYTVALTASKSPEDNFIYTNGTATATIRVVGAPMVDSIECEKSNWQYQGEAIFPAGQTCFVILWLDSDSINEPFLPERYSAILNTTPAIDQNRISYCGWIIQNTGSMVRKGIVYIIYLPEDARPGQYQIDAKVSYYLGEGSSVVSPAKDGQVTITDRIDSNLITARPSA